MILGRLFYPGEVCRSGGTDDCTTSLSGRKQPEFFFSPTSTGDTTMGGTLISFNQQASVIPVACTVGALYVFQPPSSGASVTVTLYKSAGGTGTPTSTGLTVTANNGGGGRTSGPVALSAGDTIAFHMDGGNNVGGVNQTVVTTGLQCN